jgi:hypothetical protein
VAGRRGGITDALAELTDGGIELAAGIPASSTSNTVPEM